MEYVEAGGAEIPAIGLGTWQVTGQQCTDAVETALELGYRHVDTAQAYDNEREVGEGIRRSSVDREEVFLTTKVWRSNLRRDDVLASARESVERLGVDRVDLLLVHWPHPRVEFGETLGAMADLRAEGLVEHIGVSNFTRSQLREARRVVDAPVVADQVLYHPYKDQSDLREYCAGNDVALTAYSPLARGAVVGDDLLARIGERHGATAAQVAIRWLTQQDGVVAIPKSTSREHLRDNLEALEFSLSEEEAARIHDHTGSLGTRIKNRLPSLMRRMPV